MAGLLDYLEGIGETGATLGTGLLSGVVGAPYGLFKGITSGRYGSPEAVRIGSVRRHWALREGVGKTATVRSRLATN